ncbi:MAG TPA: YbaY family lipoprotein [Xanthomonadales bacterium]|nr:YbaY family lipoprotein [Xanthomonadales bacterium]
MKDLLKLSPLKFGAIVFCSVILAACNSKEQEQPVEVVDTEPVMETIRGTVTYEEDIILAPESITTVELIDVTAADEEPIVIAEGFVAGFGAPPLAFSLEYDSTQIKEGHKYELRAVVMEQVRLMFKSVGSYPVLEANSSGPVEIMLKHVPGGKVERMAEVVRANNPTLSGFYYYAGGEGEFIDCETASVYPVAREGGVYSLESGYRREAKKSGEQIFTVVSGNYVTRPARDGRGKEDFLVIEQVEEMSASGDCP